MTTTATTTATTDGVRIDPSLRLAHDGVHWAATFQMMLGALCSHLCADGPLPARLDVLAGDGDAVETVAATLRAVDDTSLLFTDRGPIPRSAVLAIAI
jgi:hypothetical protein